MPHAPNSIIFSDLSRSIFVANIQKNPSLFFMARIIYQAMDMLIAICVYNILVTRAPCTLYVQNNLCVKGRKKCLVAAGCYGSCETRA